MSESPCVFISYRRADTQPVASRLANDLSEALGKERVFFDQDRLEAGDEWARRIQDNVKAASVLLALIGTRWLSVQDEKSGMRRLDIPDDWVRQEIALALSLADQPNRKIIPVLVDGAPTPSEASKLPDVISRLVGLQVAGLNSGSNERWSADLAKLCALLGAPAHVVGRRRAARNPEWLAPYLQRFDVRDVVPVLATSLLSGKTPRALELAVSQRSASAPPAADTDAADKEARGLVPHQTLESVIAESAKRLIVIGEGGAGKSFLLRNVNARLAARAVGDESAPIPVYADLTRFTSTREAADITRSTLETLGLRSQDEAGFRALAEDRAFVFMFDSFNETPEHTHRTCAHALIAFAKHWGERHTYLIGSRNVPELGEFTQRPPFLTYEMLPLTGEQVRAYLQDLGLQELYEKMPQALRDLAGNPFMLQAIAVSLAGTSARDLPRNRARLYQTFLARWMEKGADHELRAYSYERVKAPALAFVGARMTAAAQTTIALDAKLQEGLRRELTRVYKRVRRLGGMPGDWTVDQLIDELMRDGMIQVRDGQLQFRHQSIQEYFTARYFASTAPLALASFIPKDRVDSYYNANLPSHRLVPVVLMMVGLLDDSREVISALAERNPLVAAAAIASADRLDARTVRKLEDRWIAAAKAPKVSDRAVAWSCLCVLPKTARIVETLADVVITETDESPSFDLASAALVDEVAARLIDGLLTADAERYATHKRDVARVIDDVRSTGPIITLCERWLSAGTDELRIRIESVLATFDHDLLERAVSEAAVRAEPAMSTALLRIPEESRSWLPLRRSFHFGPRHAARRNAETARHALAFASVDEDLLAAELRSPDETRRRAAARIAAERKLPFEEIIFEALLSFDAPEARADLVQSAVALLGETRTLSRLIDASHAEPRPLATIDADTFSAMREAAPDDEEAIEVKGRRIARQSLLDALRPGLPSWVDADTGFADLGDSKFQIGARSNGLMLSFSGTEATLTVGPTQLRAAAAIAEIGPAAIPELERMASSSDQRRRAIGIAGLGRHAAPGIGKRLLRTLASDTRDLVVDAALKAFSSLRDPASIELLDYLLGLVPDESPPGKGGAWWRSLEGGARAMSRKSSIHRALVQNELDAPVLTKLLDALRGDNRDCRPAALGEVRRWLSERTLSPERRRAWRTPAVEDALLAIALHDADESLRRMAADLLPLLESTSIRTRLEPDLRAEDVEARLAAAEVLWWAFEADVVGIVSPVISPLADPREPERIRQRVGSLLEAIPGAMDAFYRPIQAALDVDDFHAGLPLLDDAIKVFPSDANLWWWRARVLAALDLEQQAVESFQRAEALLNSFAGIPSELAKVYVELGDNEKAVEAAKRAVDLASDSSEMHAIHAWACFKAGATADATAAARLACDLDPVNIMAIFVMILAHLAAGDVPAAAAARDQGVLVMTHLPAPAPPAFLETFLRELATFARQDIDAEVFVSNTRRVFSDSQR